MLGQWDQIKNEKKEKKSESERGWTDVGPGIRDRKFRSAASVNWWKYKMNCFIHCSTRWIVSRHTPTHTSLSLMPLFLCPGGRFYTSHTWTKGVKRRGRVDGWEDLVLWRKGLCGGGGQRHPAHSMTHRRSGHRNTRAWQIAASR